MSSVLYAANSAKDENGRKKLCSYTMYIYTVDLDQVAHVKVPPMNLQANWAAQGKMKLVSITVFGAGQIGIFLELSDHVIRENED